MATKYTSKLKNKKILILGGTSGIGYSVAEASIENGAKVTISGSTQQKVTSTIDRLLQSYPDATDRINGLECDLANEDSTKVESNIKALLDFATADTVKLDHIVKTSGNSLQLPKYTDITTEQFFTMQKVRLMGSTLLAKHAINHINISRQSSITFTSGINYYKPSPGWSMVAATGAGIDGLTKGLAIDMKPVRVNCVAPGAIITEMWDNQFQNPEQLDKVKEQYASKHLVGGLGQPEDTAEAYLYFMRDSFVDGQTLVTEGGYLLSS